MQADVAIIGGSGLYDAEMIEHPVEQAVDTPFGKVGVKIGTYKGKRVAFLARHGAGHTVAPHRVNYRANIDALHRLGVKYVFASNACGSLREDVAPGDLVIIDQFIDKTSARHMTFYEEGKVCHIQVAEPFCPEMRRLLVAKGRELGLPVKAGGTYVCIQGPRFSTKAESAVNRAMGADVVGMTLVPECVLAKEHGLCYASVALSTDYDCWKETPVQHKDVLGVMKDNAWKAKQLIFAVIEALPAKKSCNCEKAADGAFG